MICPKTVKMRYNLQKRNRGTNTQIREVILTKNIQAMKQSAKSAYPKVSFCIYKKRERVNSHVKCVNASTSSRASIDGNGKIKYTNSSSGFQHTNGSITKFSSQYPSSRRVLNKRYSFYISKEIIKMNASNSTRCNFDFTLKLGLK